MSLFEWFIGFLKKHIITTPNFKKLFILQINGCNFKTTNITNMKKLVALIFVFAIFGCSSLKNTQQTTSSEDKGKHILPPNTASNKYSKIRQGGNQ